MKTILSILAVLLLIGVSSAAVYVGYNYMADAFFTVDEPTDEAIQTLVSTNNVDWYESIDVQSSANMGFIPLYFKHTNVGTGDIIGNIHYEIECLEGLENNNGRLEDFYDEFATSGFEYIAGVQISPTDSPDFVNVNSDSFYSYNHEDGIATFNISDVHTFTVNDEQSTRFNIALHNDAYGTYTIRGYAVV